MKCRNPYLNRQGMLFPCGQCMPCRVNRRREWTHRIMLEKNLHPVSCFVTLTYEEKHLPMSASGYPTLSRLHLQLWLKRFRVEIAPLKIRFYACGEYGEKTQRPHYHLALFNFPMCMAGRTIRDVRTNRPMAWKCCSVCQVIYKTWGMGDVDVGELTTESAQYVAQYVTKKMTKPDDERLNGRYPEFSQPSLRGGGIGAGFMKHVAKAICEQEVDLVAEQGDVPSSLRHGKRIMPLGRYLRRRLRKEVGLDEKAPQSTIDEAQARLQDMRDHAFETSQSFKKVVMEAADESVRQMENKQKIFKRRNVL